VGLHLLQLSVDETRASLYDETSVALLGEGSLFERPERRGQKRANNNSNNVTDILR